MRYVKQETHNSCGIAAVAMVAGCTFAEAKTHIGKSGLTRTKDLIAGLQSLGVHCGHKCQRIRKDELAVQNGIFKISWINKKSHWVVCFEGVVYDPDNPSQKTLEYEYGKATSYLPVEMSDRMD